jgi:hypothetical protein
MDSLIEYIPIDTDEHFPVLKNLWEFFASKGNKTVFVSLGNSKSPLVDLHFSESLGCKIHLICETKENEEKWNEVKEVLKTRKVLETTSNFAKLAVKKWVLPQNILLSSNPLHFSSVKQSISSLCSALGVEERIDILKIDTSTTKLAESLYGILHFGYRPGIILVHWETSPDSTLETTLLAGHLQNLGYGLVAKSGNNYLYYFTDKNVYEMCSWETNEVPNPLVAKILETVHMKNPEKE